MSASLQAVRSNGALLKVSCEKRIETPIDAPYMAACERQVRALAAALSAKWPRDLAPIDPDAVTYHWTAWDCIDGVDFGFCRHFGIAQIPLEWITAASDSLPRPKPTRGSP
jgi:hypothetical protein